MKASSAMAFISSVEGACARTANGMAVSTVATSALLRIQENDFGLVRSMPAVDRVRFIIGLCSPGVFAGEFAGRLVGDSPRVSRPKRVIQFPAPLAEKC